MGMLGPHSLNIQGCFPFLFGFQSGSRKTVPKQTVSRIVFACPDMGIYGSK